MAHYSPPVTREAGGGEGGRERKRTGPGSKDRAELTKTSAKKKSVAVVAHMQFGCIKCYTNR